MTFGKSLSSRLRQRLTLQRPHLIDNGRGGRKPAPGEDGWVDIVTRLPAEVIALRGDEAVRHSVERRVQLWRVTVRNRAGVTPGCRIRWGEIVMDIKSAAPNEAGDGLVMTCESGAKP